MLLSNIKTNWHKWHALNKPDFKNILYNLLFLITGFKIEHTILAVILIVPILGATNSMTDADITPRQLFSFLAVSISICILSIKRIFKKEISIDFNAIAIIITIICWGESVYTILQLNNIVPQVSIYNITGHFDNPAGLISCLCIGLPFSLYFCNKINSPYNCIAWLCVILIVSAIAISQSRTGIVSAILTVSVWVIKNRGNSLFRYIGLITIIIVAIIISSYFMRKDSADGRLLIWVNTWKMIINSPIIGYGLNGFKQYYMHYQAAFFDNTPNSEWTILADNVMYPFNEYLRLLVNYGIIGAIICLSIIITLLLICYRKPTESRIIALLSIVAIGILSLFSYPFSYPFTIIILIIDIYIILKGTIKMKALKTAFIPIIIFIISSITTVSIINRIADERRWKQAYIRHDMTEYGRLIQRFNENPFFLYNYAVELYNSGNKSKSLETALLCRTFLANYDLELLIGDLYQDLGMSKDAEKHYQHALNMCPCRFMPLNNLYDLYCSTGEYDKAILIAHIVEDKPIKVKSLTVFQIKHKMRQALTNNINN